MQFQITPSCQDYIWKCLWGGKEVRCKSLFRITPTDSGYCCAFNLIPPKIKTVPGDLGSPDEIFAGEEDADEDADEELEDSAKCPQVPKSSREWDLACNEVSCHFLKKPLEQIFES